MKGKIFIVIFLLSGLFSGCDFTEDGCEYYGWKVSECHWDHLSTDQQQPVFSEMNIVYYPKTGEATRLDVGRSEQFENEVIRRRLPIGEYDLLVFNKGNNPVRGLEDRVQDAEIYSDLEDAGGKKYIMTDQEFVYSTFTRGVEIFCDDTTYCHFRPRILVQKIIFNVHVKGQNIQKMKADLEGVTTSRLLSTGQKGVEYASRKFDFERKDGNNYQKEILVFGINNVPQNILSITGEFGNGITGDVDLDLSKPLKNFIADQIEINIEIDISPNLTITASITNWRNMDWGTIIIH